MSKVQLKNINKIYPNGVQAVFDFNLDIEDGEFVVLVGPSGCGKSTTLRMVAGLESISSGEFTIDELLCNDLAPVERDIAMVFQNYALYPNMTVYENVGISLRIRHEDKVESHKLVKEVAQKLDLDRFLNRLPGNLSGGQCQRVALGRTVVRNPKMFLMDEPLSNLDAKLREKTRTEIVALQKELGVTTLYVTHDQIEAMTMADRIVVMSNGYVQQVDTPYNIYNNPKNLFVAGFMGSPNMNFIDGKIEGEYFVTPSFKFKLSNKKVPNIKQYNDKEMVLGIRPENILSDNLGLEKYKDNVLKLKVDYSEFLGHKYDVTLEFEDKKIITIVDSRNFVNNDTIDVVFDLEKVHIFDKETSEKVSEVL